MTRTFILAAAAVALLAGSVIAQPPGDARRDGPRYSEGARIGDGERYGDRDGGRDRGRSSITLFNGPDFSGRPFQSFDEITNLPKQDNDRAMSLRIDGRRAWQVCTNSDFKGRCQVFDHDVRDLRQFGLDRQISSARPVR